jgi:hypothetical protein
VNTSEEYIALVQRLAALTPQGIMDGARTFANQPRAMFFCKLIAPRLDAVSSLDHLTGAIQSMLAERIDASRGFIKEFTASVMNHIFFLSESPRKLYCFM